MSSPDPALEHVYETLDIHSDHRDALKEVGIESIEDILRLKFRLRHQNVPGVKPQPQRLLFDFVCWWRLQKAPDILNGFDWDVYNDFVNDHSKKKQSLDLIEIDCEQGRLLGKHLFQLFKVGDQFFYDHIISVQEKRDALVDFITEEVKEGLGEFLKKRCNFDLDEVIHETIEDLLGVPMRHFVHGETQIGKTAFKAVIIVICLYMKIPVVVITHGKDGSKELVQKLVKFTEGSIAGGKIFSPYEETNPADVQEGFNTGGCVVVPYTLQKLGLASSVISRYRSNREGREAKFTLIEDECDDMERSNQEFKLHKTQGALDELRSLSPILRLQISATLRPNWLLYVNEESNQGVKTKMTALEVSEEYVGLEMMKPLCDKNGKPVFLNPLKHSGDTNIAFNFEITFDEHGATKLFGDDVIQHSVLLYSEDDRIPCFDRKVKMLYDRALEECTATGVLVLDNTVPYVNVDRNIFQKAAGIQDFFRSKGHNTVVVTFTGRGIWYRSPGQEKGYFCSRKREIGDVIQQIDDKYDLDMPVVVFGYVAKMSRGISYRSARRVPTHAVLYLGEGISGEKDVQSLGRVTGNNKGVLEKNGHQQVTILTPKEDYELAQCYSNYTREVYKRYKAGHPLDEIMSGKCGKLPHDANCNRFKRKTGQRQRKEDIGNYDKLDAYEDPPDVGTDQGSLKRRKSRKRARKRSKA